MSFNDLDTFSRVAHLGSMAAAARELSVPKSTVSRRVERLEDQLGVSLFHRGARGLTLTDVGAHLHAQSVSSLSNLRELEHNLVPEQPRGVLRIAAPHDMGTSSWFTGLLADFRRRYPEVSLDLTLSGLAVDLVEDKIDVAFRPAQLQRNTNQLMMRHIGSPRGGIYASPGYLAQHGRPRRVADLSRHDAVAVRARRDQPWRLQRQEQERQARPTIVATGDDFSFVCAAAVAGMGIAVLPELMTRPLVSAGALTRLLKSWSCGLGRLSVIWLRHRYMIARVRAFLDHLPAQLDDIM